MPSLKGFSDNPFQSKEDILQAAASLLRPLIPHKSACGARIKLPTTTGTGFDEISAQLEGFARPLWVVADLLTLQSNAKPNEYPVLDDLGLESWVRGLSAGVDVSSPSFWGHLGNHDQRMVEMEPIAYALLSAPSNFLFDSEAKDKSRAWLRSINEKGMPPSNWRWFRVLVNLALVKVCDIPYSEVKPILDADLSVLDSFYLDQGWSSDGAWSDDKKQVDYYSGSFAIQYSQLAYIRFAADLDPERVERYRTQARDFSRTFWRYFDVDGAAIPFGRSLTYRFTFAAFFAAAVTAGVDLPAPLDDLGVVKGLLFRHLRWWGKHPDFSNPDGTLSIGYTYPNLYMSEDYNSPQSPYWCLKTLAIIGVPDGHEFWKCKELPHPLSQNNPADLGHHNLDKPALERVGVIKPAMHITCSFPEHHFLLSSGQFTQKTHKAREAKYGKFAYSSAFAFSVPVGNLLEQMAPDSTLSISQDDGESWKVRWNPLDAEIKKLEILPGSSTYFHVGVDTLPVLTSKWRPWKNSGFEVETILVPTSERWPGWHIRIHRLSWSSTDSLNLKCVDSGFAIGSQNSIGGVLPCLESVPDGNSWPEGYTQNSPSSLILSAAGASGCFNFCTKSTSSFTQTPSGFVFRPDANTNLISQRTLIPSIQHTFAGPDQSPNAMQGATQVGEVWLATGVFAVSSSAGLEWQTVRSMWEKKPAFNFRTNAGIVSFASEESVDTWQLSGQWDD